MADGLQRQVEDGAPNPRLVALKRQISALQIAYLVLFVTSLVLIVVNYGARSSSQNIWWAITLGSAVVIRLIRQSLVAKYNSILVGGRPAPLT
ncbi:MAG TPA: hypothetical protein VGC41_22300 [Kofleriaceae bacterium]